MPPVSRTARFFDTSYKYKQADLNKAAKTVGLHSEAKRAVLFAATAWDAVDKKKGSLGAKELVLGAADVKAALDTIQKGFERGKISARPEGAGFFVDVSGHPRVPMELKLKSGEKVKADVHFTWYDDKSIHTVVRFFPPRAPYPFYARVHVELP